MRRLNISDPDFVVDADDPPSYHTGMYRLGEPLPDDD